jgi:hypothetical protein
VEIPLGSTSYATPELLHSSLISLLDAAVTSGSYSAKLRAAAAVLHSTDLLSATATGMTYDGLLVDAPEETTTTLV